MQRKKVGYPGSVMVWFAFGKGFRRLVVHTTEKATPRKKSIPEWKTKIEMVEKTKMKLRHVSATKRYTKASLDLLSAEARLEYLKLNERFIQGTKGPGVNTVDHCVRCLKPLADVVKGKKHIVLQDNASIHNSNFAHVYIKHHGLKFIKGHPSSSCDLNPAEFMCARLKEEVAFHGPATRESLVRTIEKAFHSVPQRTIDKWIDTFWVRLKQCRANNGDWVGTHECRKRLPSQK